MSGHVLRPNNGIRDHAPPGATRIRIAFNQYLPRHQADRGTPGRRCTCCLKTIMLGFVLLTGLWE